MSAIALVRQNEQSLPPPPPARKSPCSLTRIIMGLFVTAVVILVKMSSATPLSSRQCELWNEQADLEDRAAIDAGRAVGCRSEDRDSEYRVRPEARVCSKFTRVLLNKEVVKSQLKNQQSGLCGTDSAVAEVRFREYTTKHAAMQAHYEQKPEGCERTPKC